MATGPTSENPAGLSEPTRRHQAEPLSSQERFCAWHGAQHLGVFYFGQSAFWSEARAQRDPLADLFQTGPQQIGRFDLARERFLPGIDVSKGSSGSDGRSGVWDVLPHPNGRIYFTSYFGSAGFFDPERRRTHRFAQLGAGLNELALGPGASILASRSRTSDPGADRGSASAGGGGDRSGSIAIFDQDGVLLRELALGATDGSPLEAKSVAYDSHRKRIWVTSDRLGGAGSDQAAGGFQPADHPTLVLTPEGQILRRIDEVEIQALRFLDDGRGYLAVRKGRRLELAVIRPETAEVDLERAHRYLLDDRFPPTYDFVQDIQIEEGGPVVVTRWSGNIHLLERQRSGEIPARKQTARRVTTIALPDYDPYGLYYTAVVRGKRLCVSYCAGISVVCAPLPEHDAP